MSRSLPSLEKREAVYLSFLSDYIIIGIKKRPEKKDFIKYKQQFTKPTHVAVYLFRA